MASIALGLAGSAIGGSIGGSFLGFSAATIGGAIGSAAGTVADSLILGALAPDQRIEGQRLDSLQVTTATEGEVIPRVYGRMRVGGTIIWATDFREEVSEQSQGGGKGGGPQVTTVSYRYHASFAVALSEGPITGIGRIWADGKRMELSGVTWRWHPGSEDQEPDPFIQSVMGADATPAYRGTAYIVFEDLALERYGNRLPQINVEVFRPLADPDTAEGLVCAVTIIPASGEFVYATEQVTVDLGEGRTKAENVHAERTSTDFLESLDRLQAAAPNLESVSLVVAWFGDDLRCGACLIRPGVELSDKTTSRAWSVNGVARGGAYLISRDAGDRPVYGGTPADFAVVQAIRELKARGLRVTFYPFILMDVPGDNALPDPYSDNASAVGQPAFPWRGRITCSPAPGQAGSPDKSSGAADQVADFFGAAAPGEFTVAGEAVSFTGNAQDWGLRRMILHYAHLCAAAGGVDAFLIGTEMRELTHVRSGTARYPAVSAFIALAADVRSVLGAGTKISYAADWSEYFGHQPGDGSGDVVFHLDPLWSDTNIDFVGIDNYMPLSDWRDGFDRADALEHESIYEQLYLQGNVEGGEGYDWFYASAGDRAAQIRTPVADGAAGKPWVFRYKDVRSWWSNQHHDRPGGVEAAPPTGWVPEGKPIRFTEVGCPAIDRGANQPNVFFDPKSSENLKPYFSRGWRDDTMQRAYVEAMLLYWGVAGVNPASSVYGGAMLEMGEMAVWTWDGRPYPFFPALDAVWADGANWRLGHWLSGRLGSVSLPVLVRHLCARAGLGPERIDVSKLWGTLEGWTISALESPRASIAQLARHFGFDATESEGRILFAMRGGWSDARLTLDDLVAGSGGEEGEPIQLERGQETELPQALKWTTARSDEEYDPVTAEARRVTVQAARVASESFPFAVPPEEVERRVRRALQESWVGRESARFALPPSRLALDPADVVTIAHDGRDTAFRIRQIGDAAGRTIEAVRRDRLAYDLPPGGSPTPPSLRAAVVFGAPQVAVMNLPRLTDAAPVTGFYLAAYADPWPGVMALSRGTDGAGYETVTTFSSPARVATTLAPFAAGPVSRWDHATALVIRLGSGRLASVTDAQLFAGANAFAVETAPGAWEIVQAAQAELIDTRTYRLTRLLRGQRGTEHAMVAAVPTGARVVVLDGGVAAVPVGAAQIGLPASWRLQPGATVEDPSSPSVVTFDFTPTGAGLRPFSPVHVAQPFRRGRVPGDLTLSWIRRSRALSADSWEAVEVPLLEEAEAYEVDILDGSGAVIRTLSATTPDAVYREADQVGDFGAALGPGDTLRVRVAQISTVVGRGPAADVILQF